MTAGAIRAASFVQLMSPRVEPSLRRASQRNCVGSGATLRFAFASERLVSSMWRRTWWKEQIFETA